MGCKPHILAESALGKQLGLTMDTAFDTIQEIRELINNKSKVDTPTVEIKPGVEELFDSNPELANAVYEALGFKERNQVGENPFNTVVNFDLNKIRSVSGKLGEQGATPDGIRNLLKYVGVDLTNVNTDSTKAMADYLRSNPSERNKVLELVKKEPIKLSQLPDGSYDLKDGNHRSTILYYSGIESIPAIITNNTGVVKITEEYTGPFGGVSPVQEIVTPQQKQQALQLYSQYLDTIFPDSKVKDIVYHGTNKEFDKFESDFNYYFSSNLEIAKGYSTKFAENPKPNVKSVILNIKTPHIVNGNNSDWFKIQLDNKTTRSIGNIVRDGIENNNDGVVINNVKDGLDKTNIISNINVVFEPEQIHILSSKVDIQGFKDFMAFENSEFSKYGTYQQFRDFITNKSSMEIENKLIETGKIDRVC